MNQEVRTLVFVCYNYSHSKYNAKRKRKRNGERERDTPTPPSSYALVALNNHIFLSRFTFCVNWVFVMASLQKPHKYYKISGKITILYSLILSFASSPHTRPVKIINIHCSFEYIMCWWCDLFLSTFVSVSRLSITFLKYKWCNKKKYILREYGSTFMCTSGNSRIFVVVHNK